MARIKVLRVVARSDSFRRAGRLFSATAQDIPFSELDEKQLKALKSDKMLVTAELEVEQPSTEKAPAEPAAGVAALAPVATKVIVAKKTTAAKKAAKTAVAATEQEQSTTGANNSGASEKQAGE